MLLKVGTCYVLRNGTVTGPLVHRADADYPWYCPKLGHTWVEDGHCWSLASNQPGDYDIVREYIPYTPPKERTPMVRDASRPDIVTLLLKEAKELVSKSSMDSARTRLTTKLGQLDKARQAVRELERQLEDLEQELRETL